jgi:hypothetical protein
MKKEKSPEDLLAEQIALCNAALADCFTQAQVPRPNDTYGHARQAEFQNARTLLKQCAHIGMAIAKIKGEFRHAINVSHTPSPSGSDDSNAG